MEEKINAVMGWLFWVLIVAFLYGLYKGDIPPVYRDFAFIGLLGFGLATFRRKIEVLGCCGRIAQGLENCKVRRN